MKRNPDTAGKIASAALQLLEEEGPEAVTMRRVAAAAGITPMAIYHHYPDRDALLDSVTGAEFSKLLDFTEARLSGRPLEYRLLHLLDSYLDYAFARPRIFDYVFSKPRAGARRFPEDFRARESPTLNPVADTVAEAMRAGRLKKADVWEVAFELWAHVHGYVMLYRGGRIGLTEAQFRQLVRRSLRRLFDGLKA